MDNLKPMHWVAISIFVVGIYFVFQWSDINRQQLVIREAENTQKILIEQANQSREDAKRQQEESKVQEEKEAADEKSSKLEACIALAHQNYSSNWEGSVNQINKGTDKKTLPAYLANPLTEQYSQDKSQCAELYK